VGPIVRKTRGEKNFQIEQFRRSGVRNVVREVGKIEGKKSVRNMKATKKLMLKEKIKESVSRVEGGDM
jgi:hypothetical protein